MGATSVSRQWAQSAVTLRRPDGIERQTKAPSTLRFCLVPPKPLDASHATRDDTRIFYRIFYEVGATKVSGRAEVCTLDAAPRSCITLQTISPLGAPGLRGALRLRKHLLEENRTAFTYACKGRMTKVSFITPKSATWCQLRCYISPVRVGHKLRTRGTGIVGTRVPHRWAKLARQYAVDPL